MANGMAKNSLTGAFTAAITGASMCFFGPFNWFIWGTFVATIQLERSFDAGVTWVPCTRGGVNSPVTGPISDVATEPESGMLYRLNCTAYTSGTANWRLSQ